MFLTVFFKSLDADPFKHHMDEELEEKDITKILAGSKSTSQAKVIKFKLLFLNSSVSSLEGNLTSMSVLCKQ